MRFTLLKELLNPEVKNLFALRQRVIYVFCLLFITSFGFVGINRLLNEQYFLFLINFATLFSLLCVILITKKGYIVPAALLLSATILVPSFYVILNNTTRIVDNAMYIAFVPIVNLFLIQDKRICLAVFLIATALLAFLFDKAALLFIPFLTIYLVHVIYFFYFSLHIDKLEQTLIAENKRKQLLINDLELKNKQIENLNLDLGNTNKVLEEKVEDIKHFAHLSSHNLQTPLHNIKVYSDLLIKEYSSKLDGLGNASIKYLSSSSNSLSTILHGLVDYFSIFDNSDSEELAIEEIVKEVLVEEQDLIAEQKATIQFQELPVISGNKSEIKRLFKSIIQNALIHNKSVSNLEIAIKVKNIEEQIQFSITDNGVGIPAKDFDRIFKIYVSNINYSRGIGLAIAKKVVENYKGKIWVESEVGSGTTIHFTLAP